MHAPNQQQQEEKKRRKKGLFWTFFVHAGLIALAVLPLIKMTMPEEPQEEYESVIEVNFTEFDRASKKAADSSPKGGAKMTKKSPETPKPEVKPLPTTPPVVETPEPEPPLPTTPKTPEKPTPVEEEPIPVEEAKDAEPTPVEPEVDITDETDAPADDAPGTDAGTGTTGTGKSTKPGKGTDATPGDGDEGLDFSGDGIFGRRVIYRADVKKITQEEGKIVINLCVDRIGRVVYSKYNAELSTITTPSVITKAERTAAKYRFDKDYTAAPKECGKLTFIFDLDH